MNKRSIRTTIGAAIVALVASTLAVATPTPVAAADGTVQFQPIDPYRASDTRENSGRLNAGQIRSFTINGLSANTVAVSTNITAVNPSGPGFLTVWDCQGVQPQTSSVNYGARETVPNQVTTAVNGNDEICVYSSAASDVIVDVNGTWVDGDGAMPVTITPIRLSDSRNTTKHAAGETRSFNVAGVPAGTTAVALNVTGLRAANPGFVAVFPCGGDLPKVSSLNPVPGVIKPNQVFVKVSNANTICVFTQSSVDLIIDVTGAFTNGGNDTFTPISPERIIDSRDGTGGFAGPFNGEFQISIEEDAKFVANLTIAGPANDGFAAVFPCNAGYRGTSNINFVKDQASSNAVLLDGSDGGVCILLSQPADFILDVAGFIVPPDSAPDMPTNPNPNPNPNYPTGPIAGDGECEVLDREEFRISITNWTSDDLTFFIDVDLFDANGNLVLDPDFPDLPSVTTFIPTLRSGETSVEKHYSFVDDSSNDPVRCEIVFVDRSDFVFSNRPLSEATCRIVGVSEFSDEFVESEMTAFNGRGVESDYFVEAALMLNGVRVGTSFGGEYKTDATEFTDATPGIAPGATATFDGYTFGYEYGAESINDLTCEVIEVYGYDSDD